MRTIALLLTLAACGAPFASAVAGPVTHDAAPGAVYELPLTAIDGTPFDAASLRGKVVMFVNVASKCGYTPQYDALQALYLAKQEQGLVIVGVPSNQFAGQEPGTAEEIVTFCRMNYGVTFPLLEKAQVNGGGRVPLYRWLIGSKVGGGKDIGWNFEKFIVGRDGEVAARFSSKVRPDDPTVTAAIDAALAR
jgi:glutathione peroxidase